MSLYCVDGAANDTRDEEQHQNVLINLQVDVAEDNMHDSQMVTQDISDDEADDTIHG